MAASRSSSLISGWQLPFSRSLGPVAIWAVAVPMVASEVVAPLMDQFYTVP